MIFRREKPQDAPQETPQKEKQEQPNASVQDFLKNEGKEIVVVPTEVEAKTDTTYKLYGSRHEKKIQQKAISCIKNWLKMPYIFDTCQQECVRWEFIEEATKKYGDEIRIFMEHNRINSEALEQLVKSLEVLIRIFAFYNRDNPALHAETVELIYFSNNIYCAFKNKISIPPEIKDNIRSRLNALNIPFPKKADRKLSIQMRNDIINIISQLESVCIKVLEKFERKR